MNVTDLDDAVRRVDTHERRHAHRSAARSLDDRVEQRVDERGHVREPLAVRREGFERAVAEIRPVASVTILAMRIVQILRVTRNIVSMPALAKYSNIIAVTISKKLGCQGSSPLAIKFWAALSTRSYISASSMSLMASWLI